MLMRFALMPYSPPCPVPHLWICYLSRQQPEPLALSQPPLVACCTACNFAGRLDYPLLCLTPGNDYTRTVVYVRSLRSLLQQVFQQVTFRAPSLHPNLVLCLQVIEALMVEVEKRVRGFQRMQGNTLKAIYSRLSDFKPGNVRQLKPAFLAEANNVVNKTIDAGGATKHKGLHGLRCCLYAFDSLSVQQGVPTVWTLDVLIVTLKIGLCGRQTVIART